MRAVRACDRAVLVFEDVNRLPLGALRLLEPLTQPVLRSGADAVDAAKAVVVLTSDLYGGPDAGDFLLEEGMGVEDAAAVVEAQGARMWRGAPPAWWARDVASLALPPLDGAELDAAIALYLRHDVARAVHDALRFAFAELRAVLRRMQPPVWVVPTKLSTSRAIRLIFGRIDVSRRVLEACVETVSYALKM